MHKWGSIKIRGRGNHPPPSNVSHDTCPLVMPLSGDPQATPRGSCEYQLVQLIRPYAKWKSWLFSLSSWVFFSVRVSLPVAITTSWPDWAAWERTLAKLSNTLLLNSIVS